MNIRDIDLFKHLATTLHFGRTSLECNITPSGLTRTIQRLENEVGELLFFRNNRSVTLSPAGMLFKEYCEESLGRWHLFTTQLKTADNKTVIVPNAKLYGDNITNYSTKPTRRVDLVVGVSYDADLAEVKRQIGDRICLLGNIDCRELLPHGTPAEVDAAVGQAIEDAGEGGGLIICSSNSLHPGVDPENCIAMFEATKKYGVYA